MVTPLSMAENRSREIDWKLRTLEFLQLLSTTDPHGAITEKEDESHSHHNRCQVMTLCGLNLHFPTISDVGHFIIHLLAIYKSSFRNSSSDPLPILIELFASYY
jgi:hypothetical protein